MSHPPGSRSASRPDAWNGPAILSSRCESLAPRVAWYWYCPGWSLGRGLLSQLPAGDQLAQAAMRRRTWRFREDWWATGPISMQSPTHGSSAARLFSGSLAIFISAMGSADLHRASHPRDTTATRHSGNGAGSTRNEPSQPIQPIWWKPARSLHVHDAL